MADMIKIGAYKQGSNYDVDLAIKYFAPLNDFLKQIPREQVHLNECYAQLEKILSK
jgi:flagellum-specific ATP synthase